MRRRSRSGTGFPATSSSRRCSRSWRSRLFAWLAGFLILRRRGVYFSLLTLALSAMLFAIAFRWTAVTGGESGLGGVVRPAVLGVDLAPPWIYYWRGRGASASLAVVSAVALPSLGGRPRAGRDPRERAARALHRLSDRPLQAVRLHGLGRHHGARRRALGVQPSLRLGRADLGAVLRRATGDGGHRRHALVPRAGARRAVLHPVPRIPLDLDRRTGCCTSASCSSASSCSRRPGSSASPSACSRRSASARSRPPRWPAARFRRMRRCRPRLPTASADGPVLIARELAKSFGGIRAVANADIIVQDRTLHALIGPNGAGKTTAFNLLSGMFPPDAGFITVAGQPVGGLQARRHHARRRRPLVPDHQSVRRALGRGEHAARRAGARAASASPGGRRPKASPT